MYQNIVVGTDGSSTADRAVDVAASLIRWSGGTLHLVMAHRPGPALSPAPGLTGVAAASVHVHGVLAAERVLNETIERLGAGIGIVAHTPQGDPAASVVRAAEQVGADLIVVGSRGMQGPRRVLGSIPNTVARKARCAVLVAKTC